LAEFLQKNVDEAKAFVDKVIDYHSVAAFGPWRNNLNFIADDEDINLHLQDAEVLTGTVSSTAPVFNQQKIYLDAFQQESGSAGGRYPGANAAVNSNIYNGTLIWNYSGHGGPQRLAEEVVVDRGIVVNWNNQYRLPLFITATCDFAPYDNPLSNSLGENLLTRLKTGAIVLMYFFTGFWAATDSEKKTKKRRLGIFGYWVIGNLFFLPPVTGNKHTNIALVWRSCKPAGITNADVCHRSVPGIQT
jgi:hypothetical protein